MEWNYTLLSGKYCPRQFEYHPNREDFIFGTISGEMCSIDTKRKTICSIGQYGENNLDTILGICWLKDGSNKFITGSSHGRICFGDVDRFDKNMKVVNKHEHPCIISDFPTFERLTSVHINCDNRMMLASGYANSVALYDLETGTILREYRDIHSDHINISRFCNHSPHLFATSSFDSSVKTWDYRMPSYNDGINTGAVPPEICVGNRPIYTTHCASGVVMINFSNDDSFLLASALDNEINQYLFVDGRKHLSYDVPKTGQAGNFTRAYYSSTGRHVVTGSCEESTVRVMCTFTGDVVATAEIYPGKKDKSLYIQSLRGSPINERSLCVLTNYRDMQTRELVLVTLKDPSHDRDSLYESHTVRNENSVIDMNNNSTGETIEPDAFASFYLPEYRTTLLNLRKYTRSLTNYISETACDSVGRVCVSLLPQQDPLEVAIHKPDGTDIMYLTHLSNNIDDSTGRTVVIHAIHAWLLSARCPVLMNFATDEVTTKIDITVELNDRALTVPPQNVIDITHVIPEENLYLVPILIDFLYVGKTAIDIVVLRYSCLRNFPESALSLLLTERVHGELVLKHRGDTHSILNAVALDDYQWRSNRQLAELCLQTIQYLLKTAANLHLVSLIQHLEAILSKSIHFYSVMRIYELSCTFQLNALCDCCFSYIAKHLDLLRFHYPELCDSSCTSCSGNAVVTAETIDLLSRIKELKREFSCEVISRENFRIRKHLLDNLEMEPGTHSRTRSRRPSVSTHHNAVTLKNGSLERDTFTDISPARPAEDDLWRYSEFPHLAGSKLFDVPSAVCLTKFVGHHMCRVLDNLILHVGGMNRERVHGLSRILCYNTRHDYFEYVYCEGTEMPYCSNLVIAVTLQKVNARHVLILGGKVSKADIPAKHTFLNNSSANMLVSENHYATQKNKHAKMDEDVDDEENNVDGPCTAGASPSIGYHFQPDTSNASLCFVLDCHTLTWSSPKVLLANEDDSLINTSGRVARSSAFFTGTQNPQQKKMLHRRLRTAMSKRAAQTVVTLYSEDVKYRCAECLFRDFLCEACNGTTKKTSSSMSVPNTTWLLQFGGYCTELENICSDVHVLICTELTPPDKQSASSKINGSDSRTSGVTVADTPSVQSFRWLSGEVSGDAPVARFSHSSAIFPASNRKMDEEDQLAVSIGEHTRMLVYGGIGHPHDLGDLSSLRVCSAQSNGRPDLHWEVVTTVGPGPGQRHGHSMVYLPEHNMCVLFGGLFSDITGEDIVKNDLWCLHLDGVHYNTPATGINREFGITVHWEHVIMMQGPQASPRSRHACTVTDDGRVLIFGGVNDTLEGTEQDTTIDCTSILQKQKDSLMHSVKLIRKFVNNKVRHEAVWLNSNECSTFSYFDREPAVHVSPCSLNSDMLTLLSPLLLDTDTHFHQLFNAYSFNNPQHSHMLPVSEVLAPDVTLTVTPSVAMEIDSEMINDMVVSPLYKEEEATYGVYGSLVASRSEWLHTILTSNMAESESRHVALHDTDPLMFKLLLMYFYADIVAYSTVDELYGLLVLANLFNIQSLSRRGEGVLMKHLTEDNVCYLLEIADFLNLELLKTMCFAQLLRSKHIVHILASMDSSVNTEMSLINSSSSSNRQKDLPVSGTAMTAEDFSVAEHPQVMMSNSSVTSEYINDIDAADRATLLENFNSLRLELRQEVRDYCNTACHVYRLNMCPGMDRVKSMDSSGSEAISGRQLKKKDGN